MGKKQERKALKKIGRANQRKKELTEIQTMREEKNQQTLGKYFERLDDNRLLIKEGFVENMKTDAIVFANNALLPQLMDEMKLGNRRGGFIPALRQLANVVKI